MVPKKKRAAANTSNTKSTVGSESTAPTAVDKAPAQVFKLGDLTTYVPIVDEHGLEYPVLQMGTCQRIPMTEEHDRCVSCIEKSAAVGSCRYIGMRVFKATTTNEVTKTHYDDYAFRSNQDAAPVPTRKRKPAPEKRGARRASAKDDDEEEQGDDERTSSPKRSSRIYATPVPAPDMQISVEQATYLKPWVTRFFHIQIEREIRHENTHTGKITENAVPGGVRPIVRTQNLPSTRSYCDVCATGIFMGSYMCGCCGREMCLGCMETWTPSGEVTAGRLNRIDTCTKKRRHQHDQMMFLTRARPGALVELMKQLIFHEQAVPGLSQDDDATLKLPEITAPSPSTQNYLPVPTTKHEDLPLEAFQKFWRLGKPLVLTGLKDKFELPWDAQYFVDKYGTERCQLHDCAVDSNEPYEGRVDDFFAEFGGTTPESLKLKDWPPTTEFKKAFPELFADFENAVPYPTYTRRSGPLNLASHFPETWVAPDLGPKMYNAYPAPDFLPLVEKPEAKLTRGEKHVLVQDIKGTTNLHLDLTDAVNVMLYADGGRKAPKCTTVDKKIPLCGAIWDIFPRFANVPLREYLKKKDKTVDDPIHRHKYYLSEFDLEQLAKMGVHSYRIFQNPGDAVFIPAGCAHQVRNRRACIKVAVDFLSPENLFVCKDILEEFRAMAPKVARAGTKGMQKEDVLQLWSCVGFAWDAVARVLDLGDEAEDAKVNRSGRKRAVDADVLLPQESLIAGNAGKGKKSVKSKAKGKQVAVEPETEPEESEHEDVMDSPPQDVDHTPATPSEEVDEPPVVKPEESEHEDVMDPPSQDVYHTPATPSEDVEMDEPPVVEPPVVETAGKLKRSVKSTKPIKSKGKGKQVAIEHKESEHEDVMDTPSQDVDHTPATPSEDVDMDEAPVIEPPVVENSGKSKKPIKRWKPDESRKPVKGKKPVKPKAKGKKVADKPEEPVHEGVMDPSQDVDHTPATPSEEADEAPVVEPPAVEPPIVEPPAVEPPAVENTGRSKKPVRRWKPDEIRKPVKGKKPVKSKGKGKQVAVEPKQSEHEDVMDPPSQDVDHNPATPSEDVDDPPIVADEDRALSPVAAIQGAVKSRPTASESEVGAKRKQRGEDTDDIPDVITESSSIAAAKRRKVAKSSSAKDSHQSRPAASGDKVGAKRKQPDEDADDIPNVIPEVSSTTAKRRKVVKEPLPEDNRGSPITPGQDTQLSSVTPATPSATPSRINLVFKGKQNDSEASGATSAEGGQEVVKESLPRGTDKSPIASDQGTHQSSATPAISPATVSRINLVFKGKQTKEDGATSSAVSEYVHGPPVASGQNFRLSPVTQIRRTLKTYSRKKDMTMAVPAEPDRAVSQEEAAVIAALGKLAEPEGTASDEVPPMSEAAGKSAEQDMTISPDEPLVDMAPAAPQPPTLRRSSRKRAAPASSSVPETSEAPVPAKKARRRG